jgi:hypothetical protein
MKKDQVVINQETKNPSSWSNIQSMTTTNLQKQKEIVIHQGDMKENVPELNL